MKKLIAISVVFVLLAGAAFAETSIGGAAHGKIVVAEGSTEKDANDETADIGVGGNMLRLRIDANGTSDDGKFGGYVRLNAGTDFGGVTGFGNAWWKPIDALKILIGSAGYDGFFGLEGVTGYGFYGGASNWGDIGIVTETGLLREAFYGGFERGLILTLAPIDGLEVNVGIPYHPGDTAEAVYKKTNAQVKYSVDGIGTFGLTYVGGLGYEKGEAAVVETGTWALNPVTGAPVFTPDATQPGAGAGRRTVKAAVPEVEDPAKLHLYIGITAIENVGIDVGLGYTLPYTNEAKDKIQAPIAAGLGVNFSAGQFGIKARILGTFAGSETPDVGDKTETGLVLVFDLLPSFAVSDNLSIALDAGIVYAAPDKVGGKVTQTGGVDDPAVVSWHVNPYLTFNAWPGTFFAGLNFSSDGVERTDSKGGKYKAINWAVPIGITYSL